MSARDGLLGWMEFRYGNYKRPTLATVGASSVRAGRLLKGAQRDHVIHQLIDLLRQGKSSPFEHEGAARAGLRAALCMEGHRWTRADLEADALVNEGFRLIGAQRPSWAEGQPEYTIPEENCRWCGKPIPDEDRAGGRNHKFCSDVCGAAALRYREFEDKWYRDNTAWSAYRLILKQKTPARKCKNCGSAFHAVREKASTEFCSLKCSGLFRRVVPERSCAQCGKVFRPTGGSKGVYCSRSCHDASIRSRQIEKTCDYCEKPFFSNTDHGRFCCTAHQQQWHKIRARIEEMRHGGKAYRPRGPEKDAALQVAARLMAATIAPFPTCQPILTPEVFDGWFRRAA